MRETTERKVRKGKAMTVETTTKVTCDGCGATRSVVHETITEDSQKREFEKPWYRIAIELEVRYPVGQRARDVRLDYGSNDPRLDACSAACVHKALAKVAVPAMVPAEP